MTRDSRATEGRRFEDGVSAVSQSLASALLGELFAVGGDDLFLHIFGGLFVGAELHGEGAFALRRTAQVRRVAEHAGERDFGGDGDELLFGFGAVNQAAAAG